MFLGEYQHTLDAKGRVSLPGKFRKQLPDDIVIAKGLEKCLYVFIAKDYEEFANNLTNRGDFDPRFRSIRRYFTAGAWDTKVDGAGRVAIPQGHREFAGLGKDVAVIGNGNRIELWDAAAWTEYSEQTTESIDDIAKELADAGLL